jgi:hypothetical protein
LGLSAVVAMATGWKACAYEGLGNALCRGEGYLPEAS